MEFCRRDYEKLIRVLCKRWEVYNSYPIPDYQVRLNEENKIIMTKDSLIKIRKTEPAFCDQRGCITDVLDKTVGHIGHITFTEKGVTRAKHYHKKSTQYDYVLKGRIRLVVCLPDGSKMEEYVLETGMVTEIPPGVVHVYIAEEISEMIDITTLSREDDGYEEDTVRVDLVL